MNHSQILQKLSAPAMTESLLDDFSRQLFHIMCYHKPADQDELLKLVLPVIKKRWNTVLHKAESITENYSAKTWIALAVVLHKFGMMDAAVLKKAFSSMDGLNKEVVLSDDFARQTEKIKAFLKTPPKPLTRKPATPKAITVYRGGDVIGFELNTTWYAGYIHEITGNAEAPIVEWYDWTGDDVPTEKQLQKVKARGLKYKDGSVRIARYAVYGIKNNPDPANQIHLVASGAKPPSNDHLQSAIGLYAMSDVLRIQDELVRMFK